MRNPLATCTHPYHDWRLVDQQGRITQDRVPGRTFRRWVQLPCSRQRCPCALCRQSWAKKEAAVLTKSFETLPPTHFVVLEFKNADTPDQIKACWTRFGSGLRNLRRAGPDIEYVMYIEVGTTDLPHLHLLVRCPDLDKETVRQAWVTACCSEDVRVYCQPVRSAERSARYVPKFWYDRLPNRKNRVRLREPWLPGPEWAGRRLKAKTKHFLSDKEDQLWAAVKREWFPEADDRQDYPDWTPPPAPERAVAAENGGEGGVVWDFDATLKAIAEELNKASVGNDELYSLLYQQVDQQYRRADPLTLAGDGGQWGEFTEASGPIPPDPSAVDLSLTG